MTTDEAIQRFEKQLTDARVVLDSGFGTHEGECDTVYRHRKEMAEIALDALRRTAEDHKAREEGLLVVLPCNTGRTVYIVENGEVNRCITSNTFVRDGLMARVTGTDTYFAVYRNDIGKTVFLTRQEAEVALGGGEGD